MPDFGALPSAWDQLLSHDPLHLEKGVLKPELAGPVDPAEAISKIEIDFRVGGKGHEYLIAGWSYPETDYTWTLGEEAILCFPLADVTSDYSLTFRTGPMSLPGAQPYQRLHIEAQRVCIGRLVVRSAAEYELFIPRALLSRHDRLELVLRMPDALPPKKLGLSHDTRTLGVWLSSLRLSQLAAFQQYPQTEGVLSDKTVLMELQSLGENCELGFVQRFYGAEPHGLFRWGLTPIVNLVAALEARFEGFGKFGNVVIAEDGAQEFQVIDTRFGFRNHSFTFKDKGARKEDVLKRELARLPFLMRMMIEDLKQAEKLFCFHDGGVSKLDRIQRLVEALGTYGPNWLLWICPASDPAQAGTAEHVSGRLIRGYIDVFQPIGNVHQPSFEPWLRIVRSAHEIWQSLRDR